jgi:uncharacterized protein with LGFP repeats
LGQDIRAKWIKLGGESGGLGCPVMNESPAATSILRSTTGQFAEFQGGEGSYIFLHTNGERANQTFIVAGCFYKTYKLHGTSGSFLGFPISEAHEIADGKRQEFEGGYITWNAQTGICLALAGAPPNP